MAIKFLNTVAVDTDVLYVDAANNRVGIGTTSPDYLFEVEKTTSGSATLASFKNTENTSIRISRTGTSPGTSILNVVNNGALYASSDSHIAFQPGNSTSVFLQNTGNVGIGTTSPNYKLQVAGKSYLSGGIQLNSGDEIDFGNSQQYITGVNNTSLTLATGGSATLTALDNGNVGIGTTSPGAKLHVDGTAIFDTQTGAQPFYITRDGVANQALKIYVDDQAAVFESIQDETADDYGSFIFKMDGGTTHPYFDIRKGNATQVRFDGSGNVGIGTTSPSEKLEVIGRTKITKSGDALRINSSDANGPYVTWQNNGSNIGYIGSGYHLWSSPNNIATSLGIRAQTRLDLGIQANVHMTILNNGNVGIGTTSPGAKLQVAGTTTYNSDSTQTLRVCDAADVSKGIHIGYDTTVDAGIIQAGDFGVSYRNLALNPNAGNVGIGTTSPNNKLDVNGDVFINSNYTANVAAQDLTIGKTTTGDHGITIVTSNANTASIFFGDNNNNDAGRIKYQHSNNSLRFETNRSEAMRIDSSGNVGIGTTSPGEPLTVKTKTAAYFPGIKIEDYNSSMGLYVQNIEGENSGIGTGRYYNSGNWRSDVTAPTTIRLDGGAIRFYAQSGVTADTNYTPTQRMTINADGNVGIGTVSPRDRLDLYDADDNVGIYFHTATSGTGGADGVRVGLNNTHAFFWNYENTPISFATNGSQKATILANGNVGIGTTSPAQNFVVADATNGNGVELVPGATATFQTYNRGTSSYNNLNIDTARTQVRSIDYTSFHNGSGYPERMRITSAGNVGIGTTSPSGLLHVHQTGSGTSNSIITEDDARKIFIGRDSIKATDLSDNPAQLYIQQHGGNATFGNDLSIGGNLTLTTNARYLRTEDSTGATTRLLGINGSNTTYIGPIDAYAGGGVYYGASANVSSHTLYTGASARLHVNSSGNVGIGTTAPSQKLHVAGNMRLQNQLYDSTNSQGTNGEVLTKVSAGTEWKAPAVNAQMPDNTAPASAANVGTIRYRSTSNTSFVDVSMQTGATTYTWVNIVSNFW